MEQEFERKLDYKLMLSIIATGLMSFTGVVIETAMNVTFPTLMQEFNIHLSTVQWITTGYLLVLAIVIPASAYLKQRFYSRKLFLAANLTFFVGTALGYFSPSFAVLLIGRLLQGIGTGIALPLMFNIVMEQAPLDKIGMMMGAATLVVAMAPAVGPSVGGMIVNDYGWRMIFLSLLPVIAFSLICGLTSIRQSSVLQKTTFPLASYLLLAAGFSCFLLASSLAGSLGWTDSAVLGLFAVSLLLLTIFCRRSLQESSPLLHLETFSNQPFTLSVLSLLLLQFICLGIGFFIPNFAQIVLGENPFVAGCILLPGCLLGAFLAPVSGKLLDRFGARHPILLGCLFVLGSVCLFYLNINHATVALLTSIYVIFTMGQGFTSGNIMVSGLSRLPQNRRSDGNAIFNTLQQLAGAIGTAIIATVVSMPQADFPQDLAKATAKGSENACLLLCVLAVVLLGAMWKATRSLTGSKKVAYNRR